MIYYYLCSVSMTKYNVAASTTKDFALGLVDAAMHLYVIGRAFTYKSRGLFICTTKILEANTYPGLSLPNEALCKGKQGFS